MRMHAWGACSMRQDEEHLQQVGEHAQHHEEERPRLREDKEHLRVVRALARERPGSSATLEDSLWERAHERIAERRIFASRLAPTGPPGLTVGDPSGRAHACRPMDRRSCR